MKLSIIVPVYKVEAYLRECVNSILQQTFTDFELILVDDGSPDGCGAICDDYAREDHRVRVIHRPNGGLSAARNTGLDVAQGEYIAFVDADDFIDSDFLMNAMACAEAHSQVDLLEMPFALYPDMEVNQPCEEIGEGDVFCAWVATRGYLRTYSWSKICRRSLFEGLRFPEGHTFEDSYVTPRLFERCHRVKSVPCSWRDTTASRPSPRGVYFYRQREGSITATSSYRDWQDYLTHQLPFLEKAATCPTLPRWAYYGFALSLVNIFINLLRTDEARLPENRPFIAEVVARLRVARPSWRSLGDLHLPFYNKLKNLPFALCGLRAHLFFYTGRWCRAVLQEK